MWSTTETTCGYSIRVGPMTPSAQPSAPTGKPVVTSDTPCSSGSGISPSVVNRESIADSGTPFESSVRFSVGSAWSPGAGSWGSSRISSVVCATCGPSPSTSAVTVAV
jgi:hypothetical protein